MFIDMENLFGGYRGTVSGVPIKAMLKQIRDFGAERSLIEEVATLRAYANWSDSRLATYRRELLDTAVEPVQVFGFGGDGSGSQVKNAADIELVVDALEFAYGSPEVDVFVIVSGDGGFVPLVRKLHSLGRYVVVASGSRSTTNKILIAVADEFVKLDFGVKPAGNTPKPTASRSVFETVDPSLTRAELRDLVHRWLADDAASADMPRFPSQRLHLSALTDRVNGSLPGFKAVVDERFPSSVLAFRYLLSGTGFGLLRDPSHGAMVVLESAAAERPLDEQDLGSEETTCDVLARTLGIAGVTSLDDAAAVLRSIEFATPPHNSSVGITAAIFGPEATEAQRRCVRSLIRFAVDEGWTEAEAVDGGGAREFERVVPNEGASDLPTRFAGRARSRLADLDWPAEALERFEERATIVVA